MSQCFLSSFCIARNNVVGKGYMKSSYSKITLNRGAKALTKAVWTDAYYVSTEKIVRNGM